MVPKPGKDNTNVQSYQSISLPSLTSKLYEKDLLANIMPFLRNTKILPKHQFVFRRHHGKIEQVLKTVAKIQKSFDE